MRKHFFRTLVFAALFCILLTVSVFAEEAEVTGNDVNFRSGPGTDYAIYDCLSRGTVVTVTDRSDSEWYSVTYDGHSGFIYASYLSVSAAPAQAAAPASVEAPAAPAQTGGSAGTVNAMYVRLRSGPSTDHSILGEYNSGTALTVTGTSDEWYAVVIGGESGYMYADYVTLGGSAPAAPAATSAPAATPAPVAAPQIVTPTVVQTGSASGYIRGDYVYFRSGPSSYYAIYDFLDDGTPVTITGKADDWYAVTVDGVSGYVSADYVVTQGGSVPDEPAATPAPAAAPQTSTVSGYITGNDVRFRSGPSTRHDILGEFNYGQALTITGSSGEWKAVIINGQSGYVYGQYVAEDSASGSSGSSTPSTGGSAKGQQIVDFAMQYLGYNYTWGGTSPETGFDCSGFTTYVFGHFGISLNRVACDQARNGKAVDNSALQPGDLLCFYSSSDYIGHVGIYIGNNRFIHSSTYTTGVIISELSGYYDTRGFIARRVI